MIAQVLQARRALTKRVQDIKAQIRAYLTRHKLTARFANEPFLTGILYAVVVLPAAIALPLASALAGTLSCTCWLAWQCLLKPCCALGHLICCPAGLLGGKKKRNVRKPPRRLSAASSTTTSSNVKGVKLAPTKSTASKVVPSKSSVQL